MGSLWSYTSSNIDMRISSLSSAVTVAILSVFACSRIFPCITSSHTIYACILLWHSQLFSFKGLLLLHHLLRYGSERVVESAREHLYDLRALERFEYIDPKGKDQGINGERYTYMFIQVVHSMRRDVTSTGVPYYP